MAKRSLWNILKTRYKLILHNENKLENVIGSHVSLLGILVFFIVALLFLVAVAFVIVVYSPLHDMMPGYLNSQTQQELIKTSLQLDSLEQVINRQKLYVQNIQSIFSGEVQLDTVYSMDSLTTIRSEELMEHTQQEEEFTRQYEEKEKYNLNYQATAVSDIRGLNLFCPVRGMFSASFNTNIKHYGVDISITPGETVVAILDGTVIMSNYTAEDEYLIAIQHNQDFISIYKYCGMLLKTVGDKVQAGEAIALTGEAKHSDKGPHLHFELWHKGQPLDPAIYIVF